MALIQDITGVNTLAINSSGQAPIIDAKFPTATPANDGYSNPTITHEGADLMMFNSSTWDRMRSNWNQTLDSLAARTATVAGSTGTNWNHTGMVVALNVTAASGTSPTLVAKLQFSPDGGTTWIDYDAKATTASITATGTYILKFFPGCTEVVNSAIGLPVPRTFRMYYTIGGTTPSFTFSTMVAFVL